MEAFHIFNSVCLWLDIIVWINVVILNRICVGNAFVSTRELHVQIDLWYLHTQKRLGIHYLS